MSDHSFLMFDKTNSLDGSTDKSYAVHMLSVETWHHGHRNEKLLWSLLGRIVVIVVIDCIGCDSYLLFNFVRIQKCK